MKKTALPLAACLLMLCVAAHAQTLWKWRDAAGQLHVSDTPPPPGTPARDIVSGPAAGVGGPITPAAAPAADNGASAAASALEKRKKAAEQEKADKDKADRAAVEARNAAARKENCARAQASLAGLQSGQRIARISATGEREVLDDNARAAETRRVQEIVASECGAARPAP